MIHSISFSPCVSRCRRKIMKLHLHAEFIVVIRSLRLDKCVLLCLMLCRCLGSTEWLETIQLQFVPLSRFGYFNASCDPKLSRKLRRENILKYKHSLSVNNTTFFFHLPRKMEPIEGSETSAFKPQSPGKFPKENILITQHFILYTIKIVHCQGDMFGPLLG